MLYKSISQKSDHLRIHQKEAKRKILAAWDEVDSVMLQMPTGTGKTYLFVSIINDLINHYQNNRLTLNILIVAHRTELLDQISASLNKYGIQHGFIQGNREKHFWKKVQVGSIFSLLSSRNEVTVKRKNFDYIIIDEAHHSLADTYKKLFEAFPDAKKLGVTATPWRFNHEPFTSLYQKLITTPQISWFIEQKLLADFDYVSIKPDSRIQQMVDNSTIAQTGDFVNSELDETFNNQRIRSKIFASYKKFALNKKGIIYAINKQHADNLANLYCSKGIRAVAIDCDTPKEERSSLIEQFKSGEIKVLVNVDIFTEGFDCPDVNFIQLARPTRSLSLYLQQVGRGLRYVPEKEKTIIIDNVGLYNYFGLPDANRKWEYHFYGDADFQETVRLKGERSLVVPCDNSYDEDDEEMIVIRGVGLENNSSDTKNEETKERIFKPTITEFALCDYYLVIGNENKFKVYPFVKKKGHLTANVGNCILSYSKEKNIVLTNDTSKNLLLFKNNFKESVLIKFLGTLVNQNIKQLVNISELQILVGQEVDTEISFWKFLQLIDLLFQLKKSS